MKLEPSRFGWSLIAFRCLHWSTRVTQHKYLDDRTAFAWKRTSFGWIKKVPASEIHRWHESGTPITVKKRRAWTLDERERVSDLFEQGYTIDEVAAIIGRTRSAIICLPSNYRFNAMTKHVLVLSAEQAAAIMGMSGGGKAIVNWVRQGWLRGRVVPVRKQHHWRILYDDLEAMLYNRMTWMAWTPERITDDHLRAVAHQLRAGQPRWISAGDVSRRKHVHTNTTNMWRQRGEITGVRWMGRYWYWEPDIDSFVMRSKRTAEAHRDHR